MDSEHKEYLYQRIATLEKENAAHDRVIRGLYKNANLILDICDIAIEETKAGSKILSTEVAQVIGVIKNNIKKGIVDPLMLQDGKETKESNQER